MLAEELPAGLENAHEGCRCPEDKADDCEKDGEEQQARDSAQYRCDDAAYNAPAREKIDGRENEGEEIGSKAHMFMGW